MHTTTCTYHKLRKHNVNTAIYSNTIGVPQVTTKSDHRIFIQHDVAAANLHNNSVRVKAITKNKKIHS